MTVETANPQAAVEQREVARHVLQHPLTCAEHDPDIFRLIRRHESTLDRWFTQRLGYRFHVDADTARLYKTTYLPRGRALRVGASARAFRPAEYLMLTLVFAATAAGPSVVSLRDLIGDVRSAAAEAGIELAGDATERRALVSSLRWMIEHGLAVELHDHVETYSTDEDADAILEVRPDRIALVAVPALAGAASVEELVGSEARRVPMRQWLRCRLVEDPVLYRTDCTEAEWAEIRRRLGEETSTLEEMFGLIIEARSEGIAAIDPSGGLSVQRFPTGGTEGHAALLVIDQMVDRMAERQTAGEEWIPFDEVESLVARLAALNAKRWRNELVDNPGRLAELAVQTLCELRLAEVNDDGLVRLVRLLPAAARYTVDAPPEVQATLW